MCSRLPGMDDRLCAWGCWLTAHGQLHSAGVSSIYRSAQEVVGGDWDRSVSWSPRVRYDVLEAQATERAVHTLGADHKRILQRTYVRGLGGTKAQHARALGLTVQTLFRRLCAVDVLLARAIEDQRQAALMAKQGRTATIGSVRLGR